MRSAASARVVAVAPGVRSERSSPFRASTAKAYVTLGANSVATIEVVFAGTVPISRSFESPGPC